MRPVDGDYVIETLKNASDAKLKAFDGKVFMEVDDIIRIIKDVPTVDIQESHKPHGTICKNCGFWVEL